ncbi:MAG: type II secretion system F family protein [Bacillota bacterium]
MLNLLLLGGLFTSLLFFFVTVIGKESPIKQDLRGLLLWLFVRCGIPLACAVAAFLIGSTVFMTPVSGFALGLLGWFIPRWITEMIHSRRQAVLRGLARDFVVSAAGLYSGNQTTVEVVRLMGERMPEPFGTEFRDMVAQRSLNAAASFPKMFKQVGERYGLNELKAVGEIVAAADLAGGPQAAAQGLKRLGTSLRLRDRLAMERGKAMLEPMIAAVVVVGLMIIGLVMDATVARSYYENGGRWVLTAAVVLTSGMLFAAVHLSRSKDLY